MKVTVPDSWNEVTISQFKEISELDKKSKDYALNIISILLDKDPEEIRKYDSVSANKIMRHLEWSMITPSQEFYKQEIEIDGIMYRMIENINRFSGGEWWDMENYLLDFENNMHFIFAMIYRPEGDKYSTVTLRQRAELFLEKGMIGEMYGSLVFFSNVAKRSMMTTQDYLISQMSQRKL